VDVYGMNNHMVHECECCGELIVFKGTPDKQVQGIADLYDKHLAEHPKCRKWHDSLPTFMDLRGLLSKEAERGEGSNH
jgi:hypothetical protein